MLGVSRGFRNHEKKERKSCALGRELRKKRSLQASLPYTTILSHSHDRGPCCLSICVSQEALQTLEMPRFTRRYPAILDTLIRQMLTLVEVSRVQGGVQGSGFRAWVDAGGFRARCRVRRRV